MRYTENERIEIIKFMGKILEKLKKYMKLDMVIFL